MTKLTDREDIPLLDGGYIGLTEAAAILGYSRSYMYKMANRYPDPGGFTSLRRVGVDGPFVVLASEVQAKADAQPVKEVELSLNEIS